MSIFSSSDVVKIIALLILSVMMMSIAIPSFAAEGESSSGLGFLDIIKGVLDVIVELFKTIFGGLFNGGTGSSKTYDFTQRDTRYSSSDNKHYITSPYASTSESKQNSVMNEIIDIFKKETDYNDAVIAGILGNARCESFFNPNAKEMDTNGVYSYGIWMNNEKGAYPDFVKFCNEKGMSTTSTEAQTLYVIDKMESGKYGDYSSIPNTEAGASQAAKTFNKYYERGAYGDKGSSAKSIFSIILDLI